MNVIDSLERRFGRFAIPGLVRMIVVLNAVVFLCGKFSPGFLSNLDLNPAAVLHGEVWRLVTYILIPETGSYLLILLALWFLWMIGDGLEGVWGAFRLNLFYLIGMVGTTAAAFLFGAQFSNVMLNTSLFFAFAWFFPDMEIYLLGILPMRVKWLAWAMAAWFALQFLAGNAAFKMAMAASLANYLLFFGPEIIAHLRHRRSVGVRRQRFEQAAPPEEEPLHRCVVCHRSDLSNPELEFRVARDGNDYCTEHLPKPPPATPA
ncbi:MAG: rhomboid family intramembrane serine protease [Chthoniobacteraceae bacterium]|nr:rhomboid family intramembrane serine protease [Chthoniobacteraceae bacterium]